MSRPAWDEVVYGSDTAAEDQPDSSPSLLVSLHFLLAALRRRRLTLVVSALLGTMLATLFLVLVPAGHQARATMLLVNDSQVDPARAAATDLGLLGSRVVADQTIRTLGLDLTAEDFIPTLSVDPESSNLVVLNLTADSEAEAVRRLSAFTSEYLAFRGKQVTAQPDALAAGMNERIAALKQQADELSRSIAALRGDATAARLNELVGQRAQLNGQINSLEQQISEARVRSESIVRSSRVVDPAAPEPSSAARRAGLVLVSGLISGVAAGVGLVFATAVTSSALRRRDEIAIALRVGVLLSVRDISRTPRWMRSVPVLRRLGERRARDLERFTHAVQTSLPSSWRGQRLTIACVDNAHQVAPGVVATGLELQRQGRAVHLLDLTAGAHLAAALGKAHAGDSSPALWVPQTVPSFAQDPADLFPVGADAENRRYSLRQSDIALVMVDLDPAVPLDHIGAFSDRVVVVVTSGRSSAERLRGASDMLLRAAIDVHGVIVLGSPTTDESTGLTPDRPMTQATK